MSWPTVTLQDVLAYSRNERLTAAWDADDDTQRDAWFELLRESTVADIRVDCAAGGRNLLESDPDTVPPEFKELACLRLLGAIISRVGPTAGTGGEAGADPLALTGYQRDRLRALEDKLKLVAGGERAITTPTTAETSTGVSLSAPTPRFTTTTRTFKRDDQEGM